MFIDYRVFYSKTGRLKYISHLDVNRLMQRALKRSGLPVWYTEGFNPHIYITFALPLALGLESFYEVMDFRLTAELSEKEIIRRLQTALPEGIEVFSVSKPIGKPQDIKSALFRIELLCKTEDNLLNSWQSFLSQREILVEKKTKKGSKIVDIRPDLVVKKIEQMKDKLILELFLPAGIQNNISPFLVVEAFSEKEKIQISPKITKIGVFTKEGKEFH